MIFKYQIVVDLVCDEVEVVFETELSDLGEFFFCPYTAYWIVWAAQHECFGVRSDAFFHIIKVDGVVAVVVNQWAFDQLSAAGSGSTTEWTINRRKNHNFFTRFGNSLYTQCQSDNNTWGEHDPVFFNMEVVAALHEIDNYLIVFIAQLAVSIYMVVCTFYKCLVDWSRCFKIHVSNPHWKDIFTHDIPFYTFSISSIVFVVKMIHNSVLLTEKIIAEVYIFKHKKYIPYFRECQFARFYKRKHEVLDMLFKSCD